MANLVKTLVILPGLDGTGQLFNTLKAQVPANWRVIVISYPKNQVLGLAQLEAHARAFLPSREPFVLLAESFGGLVATRIAARPPANLKALVYSASFIASPVRAPLVTLRFLLGSYLFKKKPPKVLMKYLLSGFAWPRELGMPLEEVLLTVQPEVLAHRLRTALSTDTRAFFRKIRVPILYLQASRDRLVHKDALQTLLKLRPDITWKTIDAPHFLLQVAPKEAWSAIQTFVEDGPQRRILIATATAGGGHLAAAAALEEAWKEFRPNDLIKRVDILDFTSTFYRKAYSEGYVKLAEILPELYAHAFRKSDDTVLVKKATRFRRICARLVAKGFISLIDDFRPEVVLCPHFLPMETLGSVRGRKAHPQPKIVTIVTDFEAHALWMEPSVDLYCVATEETKARLVARGVPPHRVAVTGIPVSKRFRQQVSPAPIRKQLGLSLKDPLLLVLGGGMGMGPLAQQLVELDKTTSDIQMLVVAGRNEKLRQALGKVRYRHRVKVLGFAGNMEELMSAADLIVTKPGGLTSSEALALGRPLLIVNPLPGQEAANSDFLLEHGAAAKVNRLEDLPSKVSALLGKSKLVAMAHAAKKLGRPQAADDICRLVLKHLEGEWNKS